MSAKVASPILSYIHDHAQDSINIMDSEMTGPLTSTNGNSKSRSKSPESMSSYQSPDGPYTFGRFPNALMTAPEGSDWRLQANYSAPFNGDSNGQEAQSPTPGVNNDYTPYPYVIPGFSSPPPPYTGSRGRAMSSLSQLNHDGSQVLLSAISPGPVYPTSAQLDTAYGYGVARADGTYTRLVRADRLPAYIGIAPEHQGPEGLIIVPEPRQPSPSKRTGPMPLVPSSVVATLPRFDNQHHSQHAPRYENNQQRSIDGIVASSPPNQFFRREKVYCDKWIHEGVCAFTQQGCKYKHEMPMDKATQMSLGLSHGLPNWYRRAYNVQLSPTFAAEASPPQSGLPGRNSTNWRRLESGARNNTGTDAVVVNPGAPRSHSRPGYGPIGPPAPHFSNNPYSALKVEEGEENEDESEITWKGRSS